MTGIIEGTVSFKAAYFNNNVQDVLMLLGYDLTLPDEDWMHKKGVLGSVHLYFSYADDRMCLEITTEESTFSIEPGEYLIHIGDQWFTVPYDEFRENWLKPSQDDTNEHKADDARTEYLDESRDT